MVLHCDEVEENVLSIDLRAMPEVIKEFCCRKNRNAAYACEVQHENKRQDQNKQRKEGEDAGRTQERARPPQPPRPTTKM